MASRGKARQRLARHGTVRHGPVRCGIARQGPVEGYFRLAFIESKWNWHGWAMHGLAWHGRAWQGLAFYGMASIYRNTVEAARHGMVGPGEVGRGGVCVRQGLVQVDL